MDVDSVRTLVFSPSPSPLFSSLASFPSLPPVSCPHLQRCRWGRLGVSSGACLPGRLHSTVLACERACERVCGRCAMTCRRHESGVAWFGWVDVVVDVLGGDGGGGKEEEMTWQRLSHGCRIWEGTWARVGYISL